MSARTDLLNRAQAAKYLGVSVSWLQSHLTDGPTATRMGRKVLYLQGDLDAYISSRRGRGMTRMMVRHADKAKAKAKAGAVKAATRSVKASTKAVKVPTKAVKAPTKAVKTPTKAVKTPTKAVAVKAATRSVKAPTPTKSSVKTPAHHDAPTSVSANRTLGTSMLQQLLANVRDMAPIGKAISSAKPPPLPQSSSPANKPVPPRPPPCRRYARPARRKPAAWPPGIIPLRHAE